MTMCNLSTPGKERMWREMRGGYKQEEKEREGKKKKKRREDR